MSIDAVTTHDELLADAESVSGQRAIFESVDEGDRTFRSAVKWANLAELNEQFF